MKSIKTMLLGIALLIIAACGVPVWMAGSGVGAGMFFTGGIIGLILCLKGFFSKE
ncbi:MAG: hypothetical protein IKT54_04050 [Clostridia bacterium]|nr:hypothetical protein [Clostridia bacterium]